MKAVPRVGAGCRRSAWPWASDLTPQWGHAESRERGLLVVPEGREMAGGLGEYAELPKVWKCERLKP